MQPGDVQITYADTERLERATGFTPSTPLDAGLAKFAAWFKSYYGYA
jgi:UDP-glucuronate 4-epimerase